MPLGFRYKLTNILFYNENAEHLLEEKMSVDDQVSALERILTNYIEKHGFTEEAHDYFVQYYFNGAKNEISQSFRPRGSN